MAKIGLNSLTFNNDISILRNVKNLIDTCEYTKKFYLDNSIELHKLDIKCDTISSLIINQYNLLDPYDRNKFDAELSDTCNIAKDIGASKLMFGMARFRKVINQDIMKFFEQMYYKCNDSGLELMFEAISPKSFENNWLKNHTELIDFSKKIGAKGIHVDFGTIINENENFESISNKYNIINIHYPFGKDIQSIINNYDISFENYTNKKISENDIIKYLGCLNESRRKI